MEGGLDIYFKMPQKLIAQGAEAKIILTKEGIVKDRIKKSYRLAELDEKIRKRRTKAEKKLIEKASKVINVPEIIEDKDKTKIKMSFIDGKKLSEYLDRFPLKEQKKTCRQIGKDVAKLHDCDIIHGDLTTSNMILFENINVQQVLHRDKETRNKKQEINNTKYPREGVLKDILLINSKRSSMTKSGARQFIQRELSRGKFKIYFIDFGLGFGSHRYEDKAVDIHLFKQALEAKHYKNWRVLFGEFIKGYESVDKKESEKVLNQMNKVEKRGRYKG